MKLKLLMATMIVLSCIGLAQAPQAKTDKPDVQVQTQPEAKPARPFNFDDAERQAEQREIFQELKLKMTPVGDCSDGYTRCSSPDTCCCYHQGRDCYCIGPKQQCG